MLMSKLYSKAKSYTHNDPRVITPSSIPIFILPPTLDKIPSHKTELDDTFDCWSLGEEKKEPVISSSWKNNDSKRSTAKKQSCPDQPLDQDESDFVQKSTNQLKSCPVASGPFKNSVKQPAACTSLENLFKQSQHKDSSVAGSTNRKSFDTSSQSNFQSRKQNSSKSLVKNLFRSGFLSNSVLQDDLNIKENFCNLWVLHGDYKPVESSVSKSFNLGQNCDHQVLKSASVNNLNLKNGTKSEDQMQRDHLIHLLSQLQTEEQKSCAKKSSKSKCKKEKRSKSETLLTLTSLLSADLELKPGDIGKSPCRKRSRNLSTKCLNVLSTPSKANYGYFLDVSKSRENSLNTDTISESRRFSFKNLFNKISQKKSSTISMDSRLNTETRHNKSLSNSPSLSSHSSTLFSKVNHSATNTQSDPMVNKIKSPNDDDYDKIFSDFLKAPHCTNLPPSLLSDKKSAPVHGKRCKNLFRYLFRTKSCTSESSVKHRRSRTLDSSLKKKMKFFVRKNSVNSRMEEGEKVYKVSERQESEQEVEEAESGKSVGADFHRHFSLTNCDFYQMEREARKKKSSMSKSNESLYIEASLLRNKKPSDKGFLKGFMAKEKAALSALVDVSFERLQQNMRGHMISIDIKNLRVDPLIEINCVKAKLSYLTLELVECDTKLMAKIRKIKVKKCKFDHNLKNLCKPIDFDLVSEHFMAVTEEAMSLQIRKMHAGSTGDQGSGGQGAKKDVSGFGQSGDGERKFLFFLNVELHSYIPVSRKILSSTFRKKKRIFKGQCQIHENFISSTQFTKNFVLNEI
ncbi:hypothetical protein BpHYR1_048097 [Brachionus plicatilis]|uniref:Uncharacterized protein n=1 Tax=Brachionus plicatilis TaxID=10195 RepID=A0A3M7R6I8_BRAPC|nr:hypothetical protein BpHYR1_048097 [Brachionus plicatilis]